MHIFNEDTFENSVLELFVKSLDYERVEIGSHNLNSPIMKDVLYSSLLELNSDLPREAIDEAFQKLTNLDNNSLLEKNRHFMKYLQDGITSRYVNNGEDVYCIVKTVDYIKPEANKFYIARQVSYMGNSLRRFDIVIYLNGMPVCVMELKNPTNQNVTDSEAYNAIRNYLKELPDFFAYNALLVISDFVVNKIGTITSPETRFSEWKTLNGDYSTITKPTDYEVFFKGIFQKDRFLDLLHNFLCITNEGEESKKVVAGYHQYFAVTKAINRTLKATSPDGDKRAGLFWHTQGSGKSLSMVFYARILKQKLDEVTIVVVTDRNDLDSQLFSQFSKCSNFLKQTPIQATSRANLVELLKNHRANGIFFTTIQKFEESDEPLSVRSNIVVIADEAHRSQYGLLERVQNSINQYGNQEIRTTAGFARNMRNALPNATYIGFTGTPISTRDRNSIEVFGDYIDTYDMTQAVEDGATKPIYYESRVINLNFDEEILDDIDSLYEDMSKEADEEVIERSKRTLGRLETLLSNDRTIESLSKDIINHYENNRQNLLTGKAMIVAYSRPIGIKIYKQIMRLRPEWSGKIAVVMTSSNNDPEDWRDIIGNKQYRDDLARKFKDNNSPLKIVIVVDMWLTGFDVPSLATMYIYKFMEGHNLMQSIARVNRVFPEKEGGLIVDYVGIAKALQYAMRDYTARDREKYSDYDISTVAKNKFDEAISNCRDYLRYIDYTDFVNSEASPTSRANCLTEAVDYILGTKDKILDDSLTQDTYKLFMEQSQIVARTVSLCSSILNENERLEAAFFITVRQMIVKLNNTGIGGNISLPQMNDRINELISHSIQNSEVFNLFNTKEYDFSIFDDAFLDQISKLKKKNIAAELINKLIKRKISDYRKQNIVKSEKFSQLLMSSWGRYLEGAITNEQVIRELIRLAGELMQSDKEQEDLGLDKNEMAFYDALTKPEAIRDFYTNEVLIQLTKELVSQLKENSNIDWYLKDSGRAQMRFLVKKLLKKYKYPPEGQEEIIDTVLKQCELYTDNNVEGRNYRAESLGEFNYRPVNNVYLEAADSAVRNQ
ncbi:type I restriction endonuclease subunit R [Taylorella equigenitalis]|uniref:Type I restriction enzyme endonuclease subunit n=1 Tax=Taylorella equigenitalis (strain MCE9) TaxID=937774 RepID=A0A654KH49_TAYEM|nr:type I restriction endonuclease subunit R [Taylorella equigenitalis]ADU91764.1 Type I restriction-modification system, restriction subunit R [Taylorella equigenitalis MCE9]WDU56546.1 type I restriction endonuclease subunit R [Taylorella equigenitalis]